MSVIFGICKSRDSIVNEEVLLCLADATTRYGPDGTWVYAQDQIGMGFQAFHTHVRSRLGHQPTVDTLGNVLVFDGRLDNHREVAAQLNIWDEGVSDPTLVLKAFDRWKDECFRHLVGDWALALWAAKEDSLYLARDHAGSRNLFYRHSNGDIQWSTHLESFFSEGHVPGISHEYVAQILSSQPHFDLTPYDQVREVLPAHYVVMRQGTAIQRPHWRWVADQEIVLSSDAEYDEHFLSLFRTAVQRRIGPTDPVIAQLSGGMDSTSIVCMADEIGKSGVFGSASVDTVSYFNDTEANWNELPYFVAVEQHRNKPGIHIDSSSQVLCLEPLVLPDRIYPYPGADSSSLQSARQFEQSVGPGHYRAIISGIGGDELLGGVPTPMPELANYLRAGRFFRLASQAGKWCQAKREPFIQLIGATIRYSKNLYRNSPVSAETIPPWLAPRLRELCKEERRPLANAKELLAARPSAIANGEAWWAILETLPHLAPHVVGCYEYRYPYLDRDLVEFLHRIPRDLLVRPGRRRFLMRRALRGIVPEVILERKRKAYQSRGLIASLREARQEIEQLFSSPLCSELGLISRDLFLITLRAELAGDLKWIEALMRTIRLELWLKSLETSGISLSSTPMLLPQQRVLPAVFPGNRAP